MPRRFPLRAAMSKTLCRAAPSSVAACGYAATITLGWWLMVGRGLVVRGQWLLFVVVPLTTKHQPASARRRRCGRRLHVRWDREDQIRIVGLPRFHRHVDNGAPALLEDDMTRRLDVGEHLRMVRVIGIIRLP